MFDYYFAGASKAVEDIILKENANILRSFALDKKDIDNWIEERKRGWTGKLFIDSGAFSVFKSGATVDVESYINFLNERDDYYTFAIQLDSIAGSWGKRPTTEEANEAANKSWENYKYMYSKLTKPTKLCPVYHMGEELYCLHRILDSNYDYECLCISGAKDLTAAERMKWYKIVMPIIKEKKPNVKVHGLGIGDYKVAEKIPFTSIDATSWVLAAAMGKIYSPIGSITLSDRIDSQNKTENFVNLSKNSKQMIIDYIESFGYTLEEVQGSGTIRSCINMKFILDTVKNLNRKSFMKAQELF